MTVKLFRCLQVSFKVRCSAVEKSVASPVICDDLEEEAPVVFFFFPPTQGQRISLDCSLIFFFPLALSMECISQNIGMV